MTSFTPRSPRSAGDRRKSVQNVSASEGPVATPRTSRLPSSFTATAIFTVRLTIRPPSRTLVVGCIKPEVVGPSPLERPGKKGVQPLVDLTAEPTDLALQIAASAHCFHQVVHGARRDAVDVGFLDHRHERLLRCRARFREAGKVASLPQLRDLLCDLSARELSCRRGIRSSNLPQGRVLALRRADSLFHLRFHESSVIVIAVLSSRSCNTNLPEDRRSQPASPPAARCATPRNPRAVSYKNRWDTGDCKAILSLNHARQCGYVRRPTRRRPVGLGLRHSRSGAQTPGALCRLPFAQL